MSDSPMASKVMAGTVILCPKCGGCHTLKPLENRLNILVFRCDGQQLLAARDGFLKKGLETYHPSSRSTLPMVNATPKGRTTGAEYGRVYAS